ncbi:hypothetical protein [Cupriavidus campinensis]|uniref:hypothetical protein n=1 Tax=Cupriavidus campinensis TaxID=151783 RepID=UPI00165683D2|nr:hypothetical protein [Cupriavidus campinensis]
MSLTRPEIVPPTEYIAAGAVGVGPLELGGVDSTAAGAALSPYLCVPYRGDKRM